MEKREVMLVRDKRGRFARYWDVYQGPQVNYQWILGRAIAGNHEKVMEILKSQNPIIVLMGRPDFLNAEVK